MSAAKKKKSTVKVKKKQTPVKKTPVKKTSVKKKKTAPKNKSVTKKAPSSKKKVVTKKGSAKKKAANPEKSVNSGKSSLEVSNANTSNSQNESAESVFVLDAVVVINNAQDVHKKLTNYSKSKESITIDASQVEMIDTAIFQLLVSFVIKIKSNNTKILWKSPSTEFLERASLLNLSHALCLNVVET